MADEQPDEAAGTDAADADDLARHVDEVEAVEELAALGGEAHAVPGVATQDELTRLIRLVARHEVAQGRDQWREALEAQLAGLPLGELADDLSACAQADLREHLPVAVTALLDASCCTRSATSRCAYQVSMVVFRAKSCIAMR